MSLVISDLILSAVSTIIKPVFEESESNWVLVSKLSNSAKVVNSATVIPPVLKEELEGIDRFVV